MNRRGFLKMLATAAPVVAAPALVLETTRSIFLPPRGGWFNTRDMEYVARYTHQTYGLGFAVTKEEGAAVAYDVADGVALRSVAHPLSNRVGSNVLLTRAAMLEKLQHGLNEVFRKAYENQPADWVKLFHDEDGVHVQAINRDEVLIRPESLEQIELDLPEPGERHMPSINRSIDRFSNTVHQAAGLTRDTIDAMTRELEASFEPATYRRMLKRL